MSNGNKKTSYDTDKTGEIISWIIVIILMFAFPPLGWILLFVKLGFFSKRKAKKKRTRLDRKTGRGLSLFLLLVSIALFITGASVSIGALLDWTAGSFANLTGLGWGVLTLFGGFISFFSRNIVSHRFSRFKNYTAFVEGRGVVPISDIAQMAGMPIKTVVRDIQIMINNGYLDNTAYIDYELECLVFSAEEAERIRREARNAQDTSSQIDTASENQYAAILDELREVNSSIGDEAISGKVDRLEVLTKKIFRIVEETPDKLPQIRRFMSYYLPTTLKLIRSYATLEKQGVKGENIMNAKKSIGNILDTLATGYEQQLDQLFKSDAIDIAADINVLENLMQQDGLTGDKSEFRVMESGS
jgi:hypothetical protein